MYVGKVNLDADHDLYLAGDMHEGARALASEELGAFIEDIVSNQRGRFIGMGDYVEAILVDDRRFDLDTVDVELSRPLRQYKSIKGKLLPIKEKTLLLIQGNHDYHIARKYGNFLEEWCGEWNIPYGTFTSVLQVCDKQDRQLYKIFLWHGRGSMKSRIDDAGERRHVLERALKRKLYLKMSDCLIMTMAHTHRLIVKPPETSLALFSHPPSTSGQRLKSWYEGTESSRHGYINPSGRWYVNTGGFLRMYVEGISTYNEIFDSDPLEIGYIKIFCREGKVIAITPMIKEVVE